MAGGKYCASVFYSHCKNFRFLVAAHFYFIAKSGAALVQGRHFSLVRGRTNCRDAVIIRAVSGPVFVLYKPIVGDDTVGPWCGSGVNAAMPGAGIGGNV